MKYTHRKLKSVYAKSKLLATNHLIKLNREFKFPCTILRLYLVYGPRQDINRFLPTIINGCLKNKKFPRRLSAPWTLSRLWRAVN